MNLNLKANTYTFAKSLLALATLLIICVAISSCQSGPRKRPVGVLAVGDYKQFINSFVYRPDVQLVVFKDEAGLSFMSTECTYDLSLLNLAPGPSGDLEFSSNFSTSRYSLTGQVLSGPAKFPLPFYRARYGEEVLGGPKTSIYVNIPTEVPSNWRLRIPDSK